MYDVSFAWFQLSLIICVNFLIMQKKLLKTFQNFSFKIEALNQKKAWMF